MKRQWGNKVLRTALKIIISNLEELSDNALIDDTVPFVDYEAIQPLVEMAQDLRKLLNL